jgi:putative membrane-bound dehydrogenase-like protein
MRPIFHVLLVLALGSGSGLAAPKRILFLAGDNSHAWGQHKHLAGSNLLCESLKEGSDVEAEVVTTWPDAATLAKYDSLVIYADGWQQHPANGKLAELEAFMNAGKGLVAIHWATGIQAANPESKEQGEDPERVKWRELMGTDFEAYYSMSTFWEAKYDKPSAHVVMRGVKPFSLYDECYFHLRECGHDHGKVEPLFTVAPAKELVEPGLSPYRGNDFARKTMEGGKVPQYVAWAFPRQKGGHAFGFTGGHFHWSWANDEVRKMVLNGILWSAGGEVPEQGIVSKTPDSKRLMGGLPDKNPGWTEAALQDALDKAAAGEVFPWLDYTNKPLPAPETSLFDGKSLDGWETRPGEEKWWKVQDGMLTGGSLDENVPNNTFITTKKRYANFDLRLKVKLTKGSGFMNSGVQIRSIRVPDNHEMSGYQVDAGVDWWGKLYDESRRNKVVGEPVDAAGIKATAKDWEWNDYRILCEGGRIRSWINGVAALDYTEADPKIPQEGLIGLQTHGGGKLLAQFKDISIRELPPTKDSPSWEDASARSPEREMASFTLPDGFEVELVASEKEGVGKPVTMAWDHSGRMWTMTALEYPVDANENEANAEALYARGGKDKILVFDQPWKPGPQTPRVFADKLAIPLGVLPLKDSALVQYGHEIRRYTDKDGDGKADGYETVLKGFGIQDSHLFPHQFERTPGGWFYLAQGAFNYSKVARPDGSPFASGSQEIAFNQCKLARAKLDGSDFELLTAGPNNIWGFSTARDGTEFLQEANDMGHPVSEFIAGTHYPTLSREKLRPYAPVLPPSTPDQPMGGTGLSGIALAEDEGSAFAAKWPDQKVFYLANPITNRIQIVTLAKDGKGQPVYKKQEDFLVSSDEWFRPVSAHFGPDGCLYIADWYNKIISHNEVPRTHPDRDKTRGRIWRVKPKGTQFAAMPDLAKLPAAEVVKHLGHKNARVARMAWEELGDRKDASVVPALTRLAADSGKDTSIRIAALWSLLEMKAPARELLLGLVKDTDPSVRREALEGLGTFPEVFMGPADFAKTAFGKEQDFQVWCAFANVLRTTPSIAPEFLRILARGTERQAPGERRAPYEKEFLRYLIRWAMEVHPEATAGMLAASSDMPLDSKLLVVLALPPAKGAPALIEALPQMNRPLNADEAALLGSQLSQPAVAKAFGALLAEPSRRKSLLAALLQLDPASASNVELRETVGQATAAMVKAEPGTMPLAMDLARRFRLTNLAPLLLEHAKSAKSPADLVAPLRTLNEIQSADPALTKSLLDHAGPEVAREALIGFASSGGESAVKEIASRWPALSGAMRQFAVNGMVSKKDSAIAFADQVAAGGFQGFDPSVVEKLRAVLGEDAPAFRKLLEKVEGLLVRVLHFPGKPDAVAATGLTLDGSFTVETWVNLEPGIDNRDGLVGKRGGGPDINFYAGHLRLWSGSGDVVVADRPLEAGKWTHCAVTRDAGGKVSLYLDGEAAGVSGGTFTGPMAELEVGRANQPGGTGGRFLEFRIWDSARNQTEIQRDFLTRLPLGTAVPGMIFQAGGDDMKLQSGAALEWTSDFPELMTPEAAKALAVKFDRLRGLTAQPGDGAAGKELFKNTCAICHQARGEGIAIGPDLSGAGAMGTESLLRNILTPNAQLESGYYRHDLTLKDGSFVSGFLASDKGSTLLIRQIGADERAIPKDQVKEHSVAKRTLMPEGLLDGFTDKQVADLFAYLMTLK